MCLFEFVCVWLLVFDFVSLGGNLSFGALLDVVMGLNLVVKFGWKEKKSLAKCSVLF